MKEKKCNNCNIIKKIDLFYKKGKNKNGNQSYSSCCAECTKIMRRNQYNDIIVTFKGKPLAIKSDYNIKTQERNKENYYKNREKILQQKREQYKLLSDEEKKKKHKRTTLLRRKRREQKKIELIKQKRLINDK